MLVLVKTLTGEIVQEGTEVELHGQKGRYTGWMPPHTRNHRGLAYVQLPGKEWEESVFPEELGCKLVDL